MKSSHSNNHANEVRVELKYCERCGGLWVRECGAGHVYCDHCLPKMADLPAPKKQPGAVRLPGARRWELEIELEDVGFEVDELDAMNIQARGGVA